MTEGGLKIKTSQGLKYMLRHTQQKGPPSVVISGEASNPLKGGPFSGSMLGANKDTNLVISPLITFFCVLIILQI